jgi:hypothetical protein
MIKDDIKDDDYVVVDGIGSVNNVLKNYKIDHTNTGWIELHGRMSMLNNKELDSNRDKSKVKNL